MNAIRSIQKLNQRELEDGTDPKGSWHTDYRDTAFISVGGLPFDLSEGDLITIFSQYGEPTWIKLGRDRDTGKSRGFGWIKYEDQRSADLAVDNLGGATIMGRMVRVDHARYKPKDDEDMRDNTMGELDPDEDAWRKKRRRTESDSESESEEERPMLPEEIALAKLMDMDDDDPMKASMVQRKQEDVDAALRKLKKAKRKEKKPHARRHHRDDSRERERRRIKHDEDDEPSRHKRSSRRDRSPEDSDSARDRRRRERRRDEGARTKSIRSPPPRRDRDDRVRDASRERYHDRRSDRREDNKYTITRRPARRGSSEESDRRHRHRDRD